MSSGKRVAPTREQCEAILRQAGIDEEVTGCELVPMPAYAVNIVCFLNDRYVLRVSTIDGERRFAREHRALGRLGHIPEVPQVIGAGTVMLDTPAHYLLQSRMPGNTVRSRWRDTPEDLRPRLIEGLAGIIGEVHRFPSPAYVIGQYQSAVRGWTGSWLSGHDTHVRHLLTAIRQRALTPAQTQLIDAAERFYADHRTALAFSVGPRMFHGDLHLDNVLASEGRITGLIDWEWSYGGGTEPDFDLEALVRWSLYPHDLGDEADDMGVTADDFAQVIPTLLSASPGLQAVPRLMERMTIYQMEHELHHMITWPPRIPTRPTERLRDWVQAQRLIRDYG